MCVCVREPPGNFAIAAASYGQKRRITMSAFVCTDRHIATIAVAYAALRPGTDAQALADELKATNIASVNYRYAHHGNPSPIEPCSLAEIAPNLTPPDLVALCSCLDYQSCERPDFDPAPLAAIRDQFAANVRHGIKSPVWSI